MTKANPNGKLRKKFSIDDLSKLNQLRKLNTGWGDIAREFGTNITCVKNAYYRQNPNTDPRPQEAMPKALRAWPKVDFTPDELTVKHS